MFNHIYAGRPTSPPVNCPNDFHFILSTGISEVRSPEEEAPPTQSLGSQLPSQANAPQMGNSRQPPNAPSTQSVPSSLNSHFFTSSVFLDNNGASEGEQQVRIGNQWQARVDTTNLPTITLPDSNQFVTNARFISEEDSSNSSQPPSRDFPFSVELDILNHEGSALVQGVEIRKPRQWDEDRDVSYPFNDLT